MQVRMRVKTSIGDPFNGYLEDDSKYTSNNIVVLQSEQQTAKQEILDYYNVANKYLYQIGNDEIGFDWHYIIVEGNYLISIVGQNVDIYTISEIFEQIMTEFGTIGVIQNEDFDEGGTFTNHLVFGSGTTDTEQWTGKEFIFPVMEEGQYIKALADGQDFTTYNNLVNAVSGKILKKDIYNAIRGIIG